MNKSFEITALSVNSSSPCVVVAQEMRGFSLSPDFSFSCRLHTIKGTGLNKNHSSGHKKQQERKMHELGTDGDSLYLPWIFPIVI